MIMEAVSISISAISLVLALVSFIRSVKTQKEQEKLNRFEYIIKEYEAQKIEQEKMQEKEAKIEARVFKSGKDQWRLNIYNTGTLTAYNVSASINKEANIIIIDNGKFPFDELEPNKNFEVVLIVHCGSEGKFKITTNWEDEYGNKFEKNVYDAL